MFNSRTDYNIRVGTRENAGALTYIYMYLNKSIQYVIIIKQTLSRHLQFKHDSYALRLNSGSNAGSVDCRRQSSAAQKKPRTDTSFLSSQQSGRLQIFTSAQTREKTAKRFPVAGTSRRLMYVLANWLKQLINYQIGRRIVSLQLMVELTHCGSSGLCAAPVRRKLLEDDLKKKKRKRRECKWRKDGACSLYFNELLDFVKEQRWVTAQRLPFLHLSAEGAALLLANK